MPQKKPGDDTATTGGRKEHIFEQPHFGGQPSYKVYTWGQGLTGDYKGDEAQQKWNARPH